MKEMNDALSSLSGVLIEQKEKLLPMRSAAKRQKFN